MRKIKLTCLAFLLCFPLSAQTYMVSTFAGTGDNNMVDGPGNKACFTNSIGFLATDANDNVYVVDMLNTLRKISPDGTVNTLFGTSFVYDTEGNSKEIGQKLDYATAICVDAGGNIFISQESRHMIIKITGEKTVTDYAGDGGYNGSSDGPALSAGFNYPKGICMDKAGNMYVADYYNGYVRKISADGKTVSTLAGMGKPSDFKPGTGKAAVFIDLDGIAVDSKGNIYVPQNGRSSCVAKITPSGVVTMFAGDIENLSDGRDGTGKAANFNRITGIAVGPDDNIYVTEKYRVRKITPEGVVITIAGINESGFRDSEGSKARFGSLNGIAVDSKGNIYVSDIEAFRIRKIVKQ